MTCFECGQWVFVHPDDRSAPRELRGLAGVVTAVAGERTTVAFRRSEHLEPIEVATTILRLERRRRDRPPVQWSNAIAQSA
jgi:hypothetical protein